VVQASGDISQNSTCQIFETRGQKTKGRSSSGEWQLIKGTTARSITNQSASVVGKVASSHPIADASIPTIKAASSPTPTEAPVSTSLEPSSSNSDLDQIDVSPDAVNGSSSVNGSMKSALIPSAASSTPIPSIAPSQLQSPSADPSVASSSVPIPSYGTWSNEPILKWSDEPVDTLLKAKPYYSAPIELKASPAPRKFLVDPTMDKVIYS
jgi:hypothetical protein